MRVTLAEFGGQIAGMRPAPKSIDARALPAAAASELAKLVSAARAMPAAKPVRDNLAGDAMSYRVTVEDDGAPMVLAQSDTNMTPAFGTLVNWLKAHL